MGATWDISDKLTLAADYNYTWWSVYEELVINFESVPVSTLTGNPSTNPRNYKNTSTYRLGAEYESSEQLTLRTGVYYDQTPVRDGYFAPETPRTDSVGLTGGVTWAFAGGWELDASALYLHFDEEKNSYDFNAQGAFSGTYDVSTVVAGIGVTYKM